MSDLIKLILDGNAYVRIQTVNAPLGEIVGEDNTKSCSIVSIFLFLYDESTGLNLYNYHYHSSTAEIYLVVTIVGAVSSHFSHLSHLSLHSFEFIFL
jgi:hypothetical protein